MTTARIDWARYPNFSAAEFRCRHTGQDGVDPRLLDRLQEFRRIWGRPMQITSGYRHPTHPIEARKAKPGEHTKGLAADVACTALDRHAFVGLAFQLGFPRIGVAETFVHLGVATEADGHPSPRIWIYA